jgi:hypothetical protein
MRWNEVNEGKVPLLAFLNEGLKLAALVVAFGAIFFMIGVENCSHEACHAPETWQPVLEFFGL